MRDRDNDIIRVPYYDLNRFNPTAFPQKKKKRRSGMHIIAAVLCAVLLFSTGSFLGMYMADKRAAEVLSQIDLASEPQAESHFESQPDTSSPEPEETGAALASVINPDGHELTLTELFGGANPAVVAISTETTGRNIFGQTVTLPAAGSGFIISEDGYIVTNNHVIENADSITVIMHDGVKYSASLIGSDSQTDLAVLKVENSGLPCLTFGNSNKIEVGEQVAAIGNPLGEFANSFTVGYISALNRKINIDGISREMLQTDAAVNSGNSGGPLLNTKGQVIGVISAKSSGTNVEGLGFAIPSNTAADIAGQLIKNGYVSGRAAIGANLSTKNSFLQSYIYVDSVVNGGSAAKAGLKSGDFILTANGQTLYAASDLKSVLASLSPGDTLTLEVQRGNNMLTLNLVLDEYKPA